MRIFNRYLVILAVLSALTNIALIYAGQEDLSVYFALNIVVFLVTTLLHSALNPAAKRSLGMISTVLFASFMILVGIRILEVLNQG